MNQLVSEGINPRQGNAENGRRILLAKSCLRGHPRLFELIFPLIGRKLIVVEVPKTLKNIAVV